MANKPNTFSRLSAPSAGRDVQVVLSDLYDKLAAVSGNNNTGLLAELDKLKQLISNLEKGKATGTPAGGGTPSGTIIPASSIQGATGRAADPQYAYLPAVDTFPEEQALTKDGLLIEYTSDPATPGLLYRYDSDSAEWVGPLLGVAITDTHAVRLSGWNAATLDVGAMYFETDRTVLYIVQQVGPLLEWKYATGLYESSTANRPTDLGVNDAGFRFKDEELQITYRWDGSKWTLESELGTAVVVVHDDRSALGTANTIEISGNVNTSGVNVTWVSGQQFDDATTYWPGKKIFINLVEYTIDVVLSPTLLTLTTSAGVQAGVVYYTPFGKVDRVTGTNFVTRWEGYTIKVDQTEYEIDFVDETLQIMYVDGITPTDTGVDWWLVQFASIRYRNGVTLYETDRKITYVATDATGLVSNVSLLSGTVDTNLVGVTRVGGDVFETNGTWTGQTIRIDGSDYEIAAVIDQNNLVLTTSAGTLTGVAFSLVTVFDVTFSLPVDPAWGVGTELTIDGVPCTISNLFSTTTANIIGNLTVGSPFTYVVPSGAWSYQGGMYCDDWIWMPTDLGAYDRGFLFASLDYGHTHQWNGSGWEFAAGDAGSGYIVDSIDVPNGGVAAWQACDGSSVAVMLGDGTTVLVTTPNWNGSNAFEQASGTNTPGAYINPIRAQWETGARTEDNNTGHTHEVFRGSTEVQSGTGTDVGSEGDNNTGPESNAHYHELTDANAQLKEFGEAGGGLPARMAFYKYFRR